MPLVTSTRYSPPLLFRSGHLQTIYPTLFRRVAQLDWQRERIATPDDDFLDLDWVRGGHDRAAILCHGLEGDARRSYMRGMARALSARGWDVVPWNYRGCSGEPNRKLHAYHSGKTDDLETVVSHVLAHGYERIALVGFSLGGNLVLKYLGERGDALSERFVGGVAISVPCDLEAGCYRMARTENRIYMGYFLRKLRRKVREKRDMYPEDVDLSGYRRMRTFHEFDGRYTAPWNGFESASHYYTESSSKRFLPRIRVPTLILQAADDPLLPPESYPVQEADSSLHVYLEVSRYGGHVGFYQAGGEFYSEMRAAEFLDR